ncbi:MAG TPA: hypothetical protein VHP13_03985 [Gammaproteobacteria bacterium]|jgi:hypothetical protein|nr:hypothetical protein [Gammaproteobacteria bacterium]
MRFGWQTYRRVLQEGFDAYKLAGPLAQCPYGSDERNGIWVFAKQKAKQGLSFTQTCRAFRQMEGL